MIVSKRRSQRQGKRILNSTPVTPAKAGVQKTRAEYKLDLSEALLDSGQSLNDGFQSPLKLECVCPAHSGPMLANTLEIKILNDPCICWVRKRTYQCQTDPRTVAMMMQVCCAIDIELWVVWWFLTSIGMHVVAPVATGILCGRSFDWISPAFGFFIGFVMIAPGLGLFILWYWTLVELFGFYLASEPLEAWVSLALLAVVQVLAVLGICWLINRRRDRNWGISWM